MVACSCFLQRFLLSASETGECFECCSARSFKALTRRTSMCPVNCDLRLLPLCRYPETRGLAIEDAPKVFRKHWFWKRYALLGFETETVSSLNAKLHVESSKSSMAISSSAGSLKVLVCCQYRIVSLSFQALHIIWHGQYANNNLQMFPATLSCRDELS